MDAPSPAPGTRRVVRYGAIAAATIVLCLVLAGQAIYVIHAASGGSFSTDPVTASHGSMATRVRTAVSAALGSADNGAPRFQVTALSRNRVNRRLWNATVTWRISSDLYAGTVGNGAEGDVYAILRSLYGAHLPLANVRLVGVYPLHGSASGAVPVMRLSMDRRTAQTIDGLGWDTLDPETLWPMVTHWYVAPQFQPLSPDG